MNHDTTKLDEVLSALSNQKRRAIIYDLSLSPATVGQLARDHDLSLPAIHKHIRLLEQADLILRRKAGRTNFLALQPSSLGVARDWIVQFNTGWSSSQATLDNYIARLQE